MMRFGSLVYSRFFTNDLRGATDNRVRRGDLPSASGWMRHIGKMAAAIEPEYLGIQHPCIITTYAVMAVHVDLAHRRGGNALFWAADSVELDRECSAIICGYWRPLLLGRRELSGGRLTRVRFQFPLLLCPGAGADHCRHQNQDKPLDSAASQLASRARDDQRDKGPNEQDEKHDCSRKKSGFNPPREGTIRRRQGRFSSILGESASLMFIGSPGSWVFRIAKIDLHRASQEALRAVETAAQGGRVDPNDRCRAAWQAAFVRRKIRGWGSPA